MNNVIVIGGGAAGMMAAIAAARAGGRVTLLEKNEKLGKKIYITGKGRCNVTNAADMDVLFANCVTNEKFLYSAFYQFDNKAVMELIEKAGCPLKTERGDRVFPVSDHASDVIAALNRELRRLGVDVLLHSQVKELLTQKSPTGEDTEEGAGKMRITGVKLTNGQTFSCDSVIIATGGLSYPTTGSTGDGYRFAAGTGHKLVETVPSLVPFETKETWCKDVMGLALKNVTLRMMCGSKILYEEFGEMLFTHFGVSGPLVLSASSYYVKYQAKATGAAEKKARKAGKKADQQTGSRSEKAEQKSEQRSEQSKDPVQLYIDLKPALDEEQLDKRILRDFEASQNKQFKNALNGLFPVKLIPVMINLSDIHPEKKVNEITREERRAFVHLIKNLPLTVTGTRDYNEAIITQGGVSVKDVNPSTMESKLVKGMYFAGEVLDLDALTGGFNLQIAWSTGYLAGESAAQA